MPSDGKTSGQDAAARALRAFERGATTLRAQVARSLEQRRRRARAAVRPPGPVAIASQNAQPPAPADVSDIEVRDLRAELARELDRLAGADISASRGNGRVAGETPSGDGQA